LLFPIAPPPVDGTSVGEGDDILPCELDPLGWGRWGAEFVKSDHDEAWDSDKLSMSEHKGELIGQNDKISRKPTT